MIIYGHFSKIPVPRNSEMSRNSKTFPKAPRRQTIKIRVQYFHRRDHTKMTKNMWVFFFGKHTSPKQRNVGFDLFSYYSLYIIYIYICVIIVVSTTPRSANSQVRSTRVDTRIYIKYNRIFLWYFWEVPICAPQVLIILVAPLLTYLHTSASQEHHLLTFCIFELSHCHGMSSVFFGGGLFRRFVLLTSTQCRGHGSRRWRLAIGVRPPSWHWSPALCWTICVIWTCVEVAKPCLNGCSNMLLSRVC